MTCPSCRTESEPGADRCAACGSALLAPWMVGPGSVIASRYEIVAPLGAGGMGMVFKAYDRALDETVAIKILRSGTGDRDLSQRFRSEIKLAWRVRHRNVCGIHEYGEDGDLLFISMELVEGRDLKQVLRERDALVWEEAYDIAIQAAEGLQAIHEAGVLHRDLKPANITRDPRGLVRLMDFGIAKVLGTDSGPGLTGTGQVVGSPEYMSPEQVRGRGLDVRSDLYSLGVVIYEIFTGRVPFRADTPVATMLLHLESPPPLEGAATAQIPVALLPVLRKALEKDPASRYGTCAEMLLALREARAQLAGQLTDHVGAGPAPSGASSNADDDEPLLSTVLVAGKSVPPAGPLPHPPSPHARLLVPSLLRALKHPDTEIRSRAAQALGEVGLDAAAAIPDLVEALRDPAWEVRLMASGALGRVGPDGRVALKDLSHAQEDEDQRVRDAARAAVHQLGRLEPEPVPVAPPPPPPVQAPAAATPIRVASPVPDPPETQALPAHAPAPRPAPSPVAIAAPSADRRRGPRPAPQLRAKAQSSNRVTLSALIATVVLALGIGLAYWRYREPEKVAAGATPGSGPPAAGRPSPPAAGMNSPLPSPAAPRAVAASPSAAPIMRESPRISPVSASPARTLASRSLPRASPGPSLALTPPATAPAPEQSPAVQTPLAARDPAPATPSPAVVLEPPVTPEVALVPPPAAVPPGKPAESADPGVVAPACERCPAPPYPVIAQVRGVVGTVELKVLVDETGRVVEARAVTGLDPLKDAAVKGVMKWKYRPATRGGIPIRAWLAVSIRFELPR